MTIPDILQTTYLEMTSRDAFRPAYLDDSMHVQIMRMNTPDLAYYKFLYQAVGEIWRWRDRLVMPEAELAAALSHAGCRVDVLYVDGVPAGYVELLREGHDTEIVYFGLRPGFIGRGLGKHLLSHGIAQAWDDGAQRVWVHTCNLDGPHALDNYRKRGFSVYRVEEQPMPDRYL
ncbi:MAG: GNAT family N-acetyltransferase [Anaerolineaceae bacterium]|nr:GNAT family N-acetyltransferase [Anaerolineaceae bacterium]